jgi:hypothetical protein
MFSRPDYLLPLVAAQRQYRAIHYGLTAAALLEDVFTDAVAFYIRQFEPTHRFERAARGSAEIDYSWDGVPFSHKSGLGPTDVSILWDATVQNATHWSSDYPIAYLSTGYSGTNGTVRLANGQTTELTSMFRTNGFPRLRLSSAGNPIGRGQTAVVLRWGVDERAEVLLRSEIGIDDNSAGEVFDFADVWGIVAAESAAGRPVNQIEILRTRSKLDAATREMLEPGSMITMEFALRSGLYVMPRNLLQEVELGSNNRGQLLKKPVVSELMSEAQAMGLMVPMPLWYTHYASPRPPDSFLALRSEFDSQFSSARLLEERSSGLGDEIQL